MNPLSFLIRCDKISTSLLEFQNQTVTTTKKSQKITNWKCFLFRAKVFIFMRTKAWFQSHVFCSSLMNNSKHFKILCLEESKQNAMYFFHSLPDLFIYKQCIKANGAWFMFDISYRLWTRCLGSHFCGVWNKIPQLLLQCQKWELEGCLKSRPIWK